MLWAWKLLEQQSQNRILLEDESRIIGRLAIPECIFERMRQAPILVLESPLEERCARIFEEYVVLALTNPATNREQLGELYLGALERIKRRLGENAALTSQLHCARHFPLIVQHPNLGNSTLHGYKNCLAGTTTPCMTFNWRESRTA